MKVIIYTEGCLNGRCALLAKEISNISVLYGSDAIMAAKELFIGKYDQTKPLELELTGNDQLERLKELCETYKIKYCLTSEADA